MSTQPELATGSNSIFTTPGSDEHDDAVSLDGLDHIFKWASEVVSDGEDERIKQARERRVRRQVLEVVTKYQQQRLAAKTKDEISYLQRRCIALLQKVQEMTEENSAVKQIMVSQYFSIQRIPQLEFEVRQLKAIEFEREAAVMERRYLMDALAKLKVERDYLEDTLTSAEQENKRLSTILKDTKADLEEIKAKRWWHFLYKWIGRDTTRGAHCPSAT
ncbi:MAG: hypothetical protein SGJ27_04515 [Candidatus Melainabacteria bacterium]|nr:hypothetical protein [Candidatus Melainabacteria bacterium]